MPNYVRNRLKIVPKDYTKAEEIEDKLSGIDTDGQSAVFTFQSIIPMPENIYKGDVGEKEMEMYGNDNWYDWSVEHWGTKWDAINSCVSVNHSNGEISVWFETAWACPEPVIEELARLYPDTLIRLEYADEDYGYNCGVITGKDGKITKQDYSDTVKGLALALDLNDAEEYADEIVSDHDIKIKDYKNAVKELHKERDDFYKEVGEFQKQDNKDRKTAERE